MVLDPPMSAIMRFRSLCPKQILLGIVSPSDSQLTSGGGNIERPLSSGQQTWQDKKGEWPLKQPLPKKTALLQVGGRVPHVGVEPLAGRRVATHREVEPLTGR